MATICLGRRLPGASSDRYPRARRAAVNALLFGLAPGGVYLAGRSPGRRWALTPPFHPYRRRRRRCHFCGTFLRVTPTGRYPAPCSPKPGLSSPPPLGSGAATRPPRPRGILRCQVVVLVVFVVLVVLPVPSSLARFATASAPRFCSRGTWRTLPFAKPRSSPSACWWSACSSALLTRDQHATS